MDGYVDLERRSGRRRAVELDAGVRRLGAGGRPVKIFDLSESGCAFEPAGFLNVGQTVFVRLPGVESWPAVIAWVRDGRAGCRFERPFHPGVVARLLPGR
ncbi:MAG: PilZ domain-containing protein [Allosphingosinicella sp.]|uniref:PilZ domain-containing protein n=1 Tax=Allosphingosinicella sp. TaxID=2823234 RepID=UPI0039543076